MIAIPSGVRVLVATKPVDFRKGADGLAALAKEVLKQDPYSGVVLVFSKRSAATPGGRDDQALPGGSQFQGVSSASLAWGWPLTRRVMTSSR